MMKTIENNATKKWNILYWILILGLIKMIKGGLEKIDDSLALIGGELPNSDICKGLAFRQYDSNYEFILTTQSSSWKIWKPAANPTVSPFFDNFGDLAKEDLTVTTDYEAKYGAASSIDSTYYYLLGFKDTVKIIYYDGTIQSQIRMNLFDVFGNGYFSLNVALDAAYSNNYFIGGGDIKNGAIFHGFNFFIGDRSTGTAPLGSYQSSDDASYRVYYTQILSDEKLAAIGFKELNDQVCFYSISGYNSFTQHNCAGITGLELSGLKAFKFTVHVAISDNFDKKVKVWNWETNLLENDFTISTDGDKALELTIAQKANGLVYITDSNEVVGVLNGVEINRVEIYQSVVTPQAIDVTAEGKYLVVCGSYGYVYLFQNDQTVCDNSCATCAKAGTQGCTSCSTGLLSVLNECKGDTTCPAGQFDNGKGGCKTCSLDCDDCTGIGSCSSCGGGKILINNYCGVNPCTAVQYYDSVSDSCKPCDGTCATCQTSATNCLTCHTSFPLKNPDNTCTNSCASNFYEQGGNQCLACDSSCNGCSGSTSGDCTTCASSYKDDGSGTCIPDNSVLPSCHPSCLTCTGSTLQDCSSCSAEGHMVQIYGGCEIGCVLGYKVSEVHCSACDPDCLKCTGPHKDQCLSCSKLGMIALPNGKCHNCEEYPEFLKEKLACTRGNNKKLRVGWTVTEENIEYYKEEKKLNKIFHFTVEFDGYRTQLISNFFEGFSDISTYIKISSQTQFTQSSFEIFTTETNIFKLNLTIQTTQKISKSEKISFELKEQELTSNSSHSYFLTKNTVDLELVYNNPKTTIASEISTFMVSGTKVVAVTAAVGGGVAASIFQLNFGVAFIKLFQIVEIFGKFYFLPVSFGKILDGILNQINEISDIMELNPYSILGAQAESKRNYHNKLTKNEEYNYILQALPIFTFTTVVIVAFNYLLLPIFKLNPRHKLIGFCASLEFIVFGMSYIDFAFYGAYSLIGDFDPKNINIFFNKAIALFFLTYSLFMLNKLYEVAKMNLVEPTKEMNTKFGTEISYIKEGLKDECMDKIHPKLINTLFLVKGFFMMIPIITLQFLGTFCITLMTVINLAFMVYFFWVLIKFKPYKNSIYKIQHIIIEVTQMLFFVINALFQYQSLYGEFDYEVFTILQYTVGIMMIISIFCEVLLVLYEPIVKIVSYFWKKNPKRSQVEAKKPEKENIGRKQLSSIAKYLRKKFGQKGKNGDQKSTKKRGGSGWSKLRNRFKKKKKNGEQNKEKKSISTINKAEQKYKNNRVLDRKGNQNHKKNGLDNFSELEKSPKKPSRLKGLSLTKKLRMDRMREVMKKPLKMVKAARMFKKAGKERQSRKRSKFKEVNQNESPRT